MGAPFIPSLKQVSDASRKLPIPDLWPDDNYVIPIANSQVTRDLKFRKLAFENTDRELCYHWVYEGKITVETHIAS